jgi:hypothetical protein
MGWRFPCPHAVTYSDGSAALLVSSPDRFLFVRNPLALHVIDGSSRARSTGMTVFLSQILIPIALASVAAVLLLGLVNMMRGGDPWRSQYLMRTRVLLQFVAIVLVMLAIWFMAGR